jgi:hypothetical protein
VAVTPELAALVEARMRSALKGVGKRVGQVTVRLHRPPDAAEGLWTCHVLVDLRPSGGLGLGENAAQLVTAIDRASRRAGAAASAELARRRITRPDRPLVHAMMM